jgi:thiamine pyrophosphokinase
MRLYFTKFADKCTKKMPNTLQITLTDAGSAATGQRLSPPVVILAAGEFPTHPVPLRVLETAGTVVCCDAAAVALYAHGRTPDYIVGDLDSLPDAWKKRWAGRLYPVASQETNDLAKAVDFCRQRGITQLKIVGAGGLREDHTIANIAQLGDFAQHGTIEMITNYGTLVALRRSSTLASTVGQQVSLFSLTPATKITSSGLKYPLRNRSLASWWEGALNEATGSAFSLTFEDGVIIVFQEL